MKSHIKAQKIIIKTIIVENPAIILFFKPPKRGQPLHKGWLVPIVSIIWRFHCIHYTSSSVAGIPLVIASVLCQKQKGSS